MCQLYSVCEAAKESARLGRVGEIMARVAITSASDWLGKKSKKKRRQVRISGRRGVAGSDCVSLHPCTTLPPHYKHPGIDRSINLGDNIVQISHIFNSL